MAELRDLHTALNLLAATGKTAKVSFYCVAEEGKLQSGSIAVEQGQHCHVSFRGLGPEEALEIIPGLQFAKVSSLPAVTVEHGAHPLPMAVVLDRLDPRHRPAPQPVAPIAAPAAPVAAPAPEAAAAEAESARPHAFYSHLSLQADALALLEPLFGVAAERKLEEFARLSPPLQHPREFLDRCRQHAAMMLGARKAEELFQPIFDKL